MVVYMCLFYMPKLPKVVVLKSRRAEKGMSKSTQRGECASVENDGSIQDDHLLPSRLTFPSSANNDQRPNEYIPDPATPQHKLGKRLVDRAEPGFGDTERTENNTLDLPLLPAGSIAAGHPPPFQTRTATSETWESGGTTSRVFCCIMRAKRKKSGKESKQ